MKERLDVLLVKRNLAESREKAKAVIMSGIVYVDGQKHVIRLTSVDMGSEWGLSVRTVKFICRVFIPVGEDIETVENYVGFRI